MDERFEAVVTALRDEPGVTPPDGSRRFGAQTLRVDGSIFAMVQDGSLVVKLPATRVAALVGSADGAPFGAGRGRPMKEWVRVAGDDTTTWLALSREALAFVGGRQVRT